MYDDEWRSDQRLRKHKITEFYVFSEMPPRLLAGSATRLLHFLPWKEQQQ